MLMYIFIRINKALPLMESRSFHSVVTLVLRLVIHIYTKEANDTSLLQEVIINLLLNVENLLPALLHNIIADLQGVNSKYQGFANTYDYILYTENRELLQSVLIKLLRETQLAHSFYKHRGILTSVIAKCNVSNFHSIM